MRNTFLAKPNQIEKKWYIIDAEGLPLGRLSSVVATVLRGKNKPTYTPSVDTGDYVIVTNADKVALTGNKAKDKVYYHHSGFPGGLKSRKAGDLREKNPKKIIELSVKGMLPKNTLGRAQGLKLFVYASGEEIAQTAQQPKKLDIKDLL
ncbi:50S ribosomal protein L13 [Oenococcus alcoholitolerans]|uniref:50S ribosomal protein L13 n=1 Tax=Oenococcus alcoholitolerans TaxID=931074 RepID=UPI003F716D7D